MAACDASDAHCVASLPWREPGIHDRVQCFWESLASPSGCRHEDYLLQGGSGAFEGLHSNWVTDTILACARPSEAMLDDGLAERFVRSGICAIINLQERGEHPYCGPGIMSSGFSYEPSRFSNAGVAFHHLPWQDMGCPPFATMLSIVHIMKTVLSPGGKVALHCHAGLGRTGLVIACYLVHSEALSAAEAISLVRRKRPGSVQTLRQAAYVRDFQEFVFPALASDDAPLLLNKSHPSEQTTYLSWIRQLWFTNCWPCLEAVFFLLMYIATCNCFTRHSRQSSSGHSRLAGP